jgi:hypothetical protein
MSTEMLQPVADDGSTVIEAAATAALQDETELKRHQDTHTQVKDTAISSPPPLAEMPAETGPTTHVCSSKNSFQIKQTLDVAVKSVSRSESPFEQVAEPLSTQQLTTINPTTTAKSIGLRDEARNRNSVLASDQLCSCRARISSNGQAYRGLC